MRRILVVDDDDDLREVFCDLLAFRGFDVAGCSGGLEALEWLRRHEAPDLILLDLMMPIMSGAELKAKLDDDPALREVPVLVLSGDTQLAEQASAMGAVGWISKPMSMDLLFTAIARHIDGAGRSPTGTSRSR